MGILKTAWSLPERAKATDNAHIVCQFCFGLILPAPIILTYPVILEIMATTPLQHFFFRKKGKGTVNDIWKCNFMVSLNHFNGRVGRKQNVSCTNSDSTAWPVVSDLLLGTLVVCWCFLWLISSETNSHLEGPEKESPWTGWSRYTEGCCCHWVTFCLSSMLRNVTLFSLCVTLLLT